MVRYPQFLLLAVVLVVNSYRSAANLNTDHSSLIALKSQIQSDPLDLVTRNWSGESSSVCSWMRVTCDSREKRVTQLNISNMGLVGTIPPEIGNLSFLVSLDMSDNSFHGPIPPSIFNMSSLQVLNLLNNSLSSSLPIDICKHNRLRRLNELHLAFNYLYGIIPSSLEWCSQLQVLYLSANCRRCVRFPISFGIDPVRCEKVEVFKSLESWASNHLLPLLKPVEQCWQPNDFLPDPAQPFSDFVDEVRALRHRASGLPDEYFVVLVGDMITEDALPTYQTMINTLDGVRDETGASPSPWASWTRAWTAEENRHGDLLRAYLYLSGRVDMLMIERTVQYLIGSGMINTKRDWEPYTPSAVGAQIKNLKLRTPLQR